MLMVGTDGAAPGAAVAAGMRIHATAGNRDQTAGGILAGADARAIALALGPHLTAGDDDVSRIDTAGSKFLARADACRILTAVSLDVAARNGDVVDAGGLSAADACAVAVALGVAVCADDAARDQDVAAFAALTATDACTIGTSISIDGAAVDVDVADPNKAQILFN